nr:hypothetical protein [Vibrio vulnificus]
VPGMCLAIEPMLSLGTAKTHVLDDEWTVKTNDGSWAAHWEHSVALTEQGPLVLTAVDGGAARLAGLDRDIGDWTRSWQYGLEDEGVTPEELRRMAGGLLDRAAARTVPGTAPDAEVLAILETAAECVVEALSTGIAPDGDQEIHFPLTGRVLGSEDTRFSSGGWAPAARDWLDAFA